MPDVEAAGFTRAGVLIPEEISVGTFVPPGKTLDDMRSDTTHPRLRPVSDGFLTAIGVRLLDGRELTASDTATAPPVAVISRIVAQRYFGAQNPVGQSLQWYVGDARRDARPAPVPVEVVGVVDDIRNESPDREAFPEIYFEYHQLLALEARWGDSPRLQNETTIGFSSFAIRTRRDPAVVSPAVAQIARGVDPNAGVESLIPMERLVASSLARPRLYAVLLGVFAGVAGLLAAIGIYGVLAFAVVQRTQEIGVRMALGAGRGQVLALVLRQGAWLAATGIVAGLAGAAAATRFLHSMLFGVTALDPRTFAAVSILFGLVAMCASYLPARRATRVDPIVALRAE